MLINILKELRVIILQAEARLVLKKYKPKIIAITGSVGKTSAKDAIYAVLRDSLSVWKSPKSFNGELGTPLTILGCFDANNTLSQWLKNFWSGISLIVFPHAYPQYLVLEVGLGKPNEIRRIAAWLKPHIVVVTRLSKTPVHVEFFPSVEALHDEKGSLVSALRLDGTFIANVDDEDVVSFQKRTSAKTFFFGQSSGAQLQAEGYSIMYEQGRPTGVTFSISYNQERFPIIIKGSLGRQHMYPILAAMATGLTLNVPFIAMLSALLEHATPPGRMRVIEGIKNSTIIDDTYNASPIAAEEALLTLKEIETSGRKIAILGDMKELGSRSEEAHRKIGRLAKDVCDIILSVGKEARFITDEALRDGSPKDSVRHFNSIQEAFTYLHSIISPEDIILCKGSQSMRMEKIVEAVMLHPEKKKELLVRQEEYWKKRS